MFDFSFYLDKTQEFGVVIEVRHHIVLIEGLPYVRPNEVVVFESGETGEVFSVNRDTVEILLYSKKRPAVGARVTRTNEALKIPVGNDLLGNVVDPFLNSLVGRPINNKDNLRSINIDAAGISERSKIRSSFVTGVSVVDIAVPLGKGQRELVLGDRKTGKSSLLLNTIKTQIALGTICVYCAVGREKSEVKNTEKFFEKEKLSDNVVMIVSNYDDPASIIYLAPYSAMTVCEYFKDQGKDVLLVLDDLTTHAKFYREISILSKRFPGRDSYPGDIFHTHAKLLERGGNFKINKGEASITCLPVVETVENDLSYIVTNLMGMTDGHIFLDSDLYYKGRRPAVNIAISVTRVGRQAQTDLQKEISRELTALLTNYDKMQSLSHFGAELSESAKQILDLGDKIYSFFDQDYSVIVPVPLQAFLIALIWSKYFYGNPPSLVKDIRDKIRIHYENPEVKKILSDCSLTSNLADLVKKVEETRAKVFELCEINKS